MSCVSERNPFPPPPPCSSIPPRKFSAPVIPSQPLITASSAHGHYSNGQGSLLPMPPNYSEGSCWTLASVRCLHCSPAETRPRTIAVQVSKVSLRMDGRWAEEKPYTLEKTWDEWVDFRERLISRYPEIETILPKLSKGQGFLESIFTNSKRSHSTQITNTKELNYFLDCLVGKCPKKVLQSNITQVFLQTEPMIAGDHQVEYVDDDLPLCRIPLAADIPRHDEGAAISSHLQAFRFPGPKPAPQPQQHQQAPLPHLLPPNPSSPLSNFSVRQMSLTSDTEKPIITSEKLSPHTRRRRPNLDPSMTAIVERSPLLPPPPPPSGSIPDPNPTVIRSATIGRTLAGPTSRLANKLRNPMRPNTGLVVQSSNSSPPHPKRPSTSDPRLHHEGMLMPAIGANLKTVCSPPSRRPSELLPGLSEPLRLPRPPLREFKSMQDIRATALGKPSVGGRSGRHGVAESGRNNSAPTENETPQLLLQLRSPATSSWDRHWRTPSDSSSSFGSSQLSPISSVLSSPTVTPPTSSNVISKPVTIRPQLVCRHSVDSLAPNPLRLSGGTPSSMVVPVQETRKMSSSSSAHPRQAPVAPFYAIPPRSHPPAPLGPSRGSQKASPQASKRPHTSADHANGLMKPSSLVLKVVHAESKTNIILAVQKGLFSLAQIRAKIQNKLLIAADIPLPPNWKISLSMIDQAPFVRPDRKAPNDLLDDGSMLLELINAKSSDLKKITLRIS